MNVRTVCLAILYDKNATGYEIRKLSTEGEYAYFVDASYGSIYPALAKLEHDGLVTGEVQLQDGKPAKKVYSIAEKGRREFVDSLFEPQGEDLFRSEFLLFARFAHLLPAALVEKRIEERISTYAEQIEQLDKFRQDYDRPTDRWIIEYGLSALTSSRDYFIAHKAELIALARPADTTAQAAE